MGVLMEEGWVVCRAFKKRTMHPPRSVAGAWDPSYSYCHDPILAAGGAAAHFKQELPELDGAAAAAATASALLQYSSRIAAELPQLESPPLQNQQGSQSHRALADGEGDHAATTDWRALDRFVASQLTPGGEENAGQGLHQQEEYCGKPPLGTTHGAGDNSEGSMDMAGLLLLDGVLHGEAGLLSSVADHACLHKNAARIIGKQLGGCTQNCTKNQNTQANINRINPLSFSSSSASLPFPSPSKHPVLTVAADIAAAAAAAAMD
ncbi:hypothetical protein U9M48_007837 [Paspalum notatum var. saurae]|uniref:NAC domain-containing protein n=1 Tax=Paspalum notatum var. saurae TaxID=547442 RepID=A0AAQ3SN96_PASNO